MHRDHMAAGGANNTGLMMADRCGAAPDEHRIQCEQGVKEREDTAARVRAQPKREDSREIRLNCSLLIYFIWRNHRAEAHLAAV